MQTFVGEIQQVPPRVSAIKINGQRAYDLARRNVVSSAYMMNFNALYLKLWKDVQLQARQVEIYQIQLLKFRSGDFPEALINVKCGAGTYIRSIARECGEAIFHPKTRETIDLVNFEDEGDQIVGGTLATLLRKRSSNFDLKRSITLEALEADWKLNSCNVAAVHSIENALEHLHSVQLPSTLSAMYLKNQIVNFPITLIKDTGVVTVHAPSKTGRALRIYDSAKPAQLLGVSPIEMTSSGNVCLRKRLFLWSVEKTDHWIDCFDKDRFICIIQNWVFAYLSSFAEALLPWWQQMHPYLWMAWCFLLSHFPIRKKMLILLLAEPYAVLSWNQWMRAGVIASYSLLSSRPLKMCFRLFPNILEAGSLEQHDIALSNHSRYKRLYQD